MLRQLFNHFVVDNPAMAYLNVRAWRRLRRWGWFFAVIAFLYLLAVIGIDLLALSMNSNEFTVMRFLPLGLLMGWVMIFSTSGLSRLLHKDNVEPLFLTHLAPQQIWGAIILNFNRNLLILYCITLPIIFAPGPAKYMPLSKMAAFIVISHLIANLWVLVFCVMRLQLGNRFAAFLNLVLLGGYLVFMVDLLDGTMERNQNSLLLFLHPVLHLLQLTNNFGETTRDAIQQAKQQDAGESLAGLSGPQLFGVDFPYGLFIPMGCLLIGGVLVLWLFAGAFRLPAVREEEVTKKIKVQGEGLLARLFARFGRIAEMRMISLENPNVYSWRYTMQRLYENSPHTFARRRWFWQNVSSTALLLFASVLIMEALGPQTVNENESISLYFILFTIFAIIGSFRFCFAGQQDENVSMLYTAEEQVVPLASRIKSFLIYLGLLLIVPNLGKIYHLFEATAQQTSFFLTISLYGALLVLAQCLFQIWISFRSQSPRQALAAGISHIVVMTLVPLLVLMAAGYYIPASLDPLVGVSSICSLSPVMAFSAIASDAPILTYDDPFTGETSPFHPSAWWSAGFLCAEITLLIMALLRERQRRKLGQSVEANAIETEAMEVTER